MGIRLASVPSGSQRFGEDQRGVGGDNFSGTVVAIKSLVTRPVRVERGAAIRALPLLEKLLMQPRSNIYHQNLQVLRLHT